MPLIADLCPNCHRLTRCNVVERTGVAAAGLILGVPFVLPSSSVHCSCGECGYQFQSRTWNHEKALSPGEAMSLDLEAILRLTNPRLHEEVVLSGLRDVSELKSALRLLEELKPGSLSMALKGALLEWPGLNQRGRERLLADADNCAAALQFCR